MKKIILILAAIVLGVVLYIFPIRKEIIKVDSPVDLAEASVIINVNSLAEARQALKDYLSENNFAIESEKDSLDGDQSVADFIFTIPAEKASALEEKLTSISSDKIIYGGKTIMFALENNPKEIRIHLRIVEY
jgi:hypothetical protein